MATTLPPKTQPNAVIPKTENPATATPTATVALGDAPLPGDTKAAPTAKPAAPVAAKDSVARDKGPGKLKESPLKDLTTYDLPASEA